MNAKPSVERQPLFCDTDPAETLDWVESLEAVINLRGSKRAEYLLKRLRHLALQHHLRWPQTGLYLNTISAENEPPYPGDLSLERRITAAMRWNALVMVVRANRACPGLGGHLATYASAADLFEVAFHHFLQAEGHPQGADLVFFQPHASPGVYARAYLEGRLSQKQLERFRREVAGNGLASYPHPRLMPAFWQFPTGSMGLGPLQAIYQARFMKYLGNRGLLDTSGRRVWCFLGDGEMDEPEARAALHFAVHEGLNNLIFVVNCNLQRLDGPVRGNGSIVRELEALFGSAGWDVTKVLWGQGWDHLLARDVEGLIAARLEQTVDGDLQTYKAEGGAFGRETFFGVCPKLSALVADLSDEDIAGLERGGHDPTKIYAAYTKALTADSPAVVLAQTVKGYGLGDGESRNVAHGQKTLSQRALLAFRDRFELPLGDEQVLALEYYRPSELSAETIYIRERRSALGGYLPTRRQVSQQVKIPSMADFLAAVTGAKSREVSTTMVFSQLLRVFLKAPKLKERVVPIIPDEARTFGFDGLFAQLGIYSPVGQRYRSEDATKLLRYREDRSGQMLQEGINEDGAFASWLAAATSYSTHDFPVLPFYTFYAMFGFQRIGDLAWAAADARARGFLMGATAGRTTLNGEGLQHQDGQSLIHAALIPSCRAYDPCFADELAVIVRQGATEMLEEQQDVFYYITLMNETYPHRALPKNCEDGVIQGMYLLQAPPEGADAQVHLLGSGTILREVLKAAEALESQGVTSCVWSVTSYGELRREAQQTKGTPFVTKKLSDGLPVIAVTDYVRLVPDMIRAYVPGVYVSLGTDGYGRSASRAELRDYFGISSRHIAETALATIKPVNTIKEI